jgi:hypothetical protein
MFLNIQKIISNTLNTKIRKLAQNMLKILFSLLKNKNYSLDLLLMK